MTPHAEAIAFLTARGFYAKQKGDGVESMIIAARGTISLGGIHVFDGGVVYMKWQNDTWDLVIPIAVPGSIVEHGYTTTAACERTLKYLQTSDDQIRAAMKRAKHPSMEYWYPDCLILETEHFSQ